MQVLPIVDDPPVSEQSEVPSPDIQLLDPEDPKEVIYCL